MGSQFRVCWLCRPYPGWGGGGSVTLLPFPKMRCTAGKQCNVTSSWHQNTPFDAFFLLFPGRHRRRAYSGWSSATPHPPPPPVLVWIRPCCETTNLCEKVSRKNMAQGMEMRTEDEAGQNKASNENEGQSRTNAQLCSAKPKGSNY